MALSANQKLFLAAYATKGSIKGAAKLAGQDRNNHVRWMRESEAYRAAFAEADAEHTDTLIAEVHRRAAEGINDPVIYQGALQYEPQRDPKTGAVKRDKKGMPVLSMKPLVIKRYSDNLLMFLLKRKDPSFRDNSTVAVTGPAGAPLEIAVRFVNPPPAAE